MPEHEGNEKALTKIRPVIFCEMLMVYDLIRCGDLRSIKLGSRKVSRKALLDFVEQFEGQTVELPGVRAE